jgi:hypothetical protein
MVCPVHNGHHGNNSADWVPKSRLDEGAEKLFLSSVLRTQRASPTKTQGWVNRDGQKSSVPSIGHQLTLLVKHLPTMAVAKEMLGGLLLPSKP